MNAMLTRMYALSGLQVVQDLYENLRWNMLGCAMHMQNICMHICALPGCVSENVQDTCNAYASHMQAYAGIC